MTTSPRQSSADLETELLQSEGPETPPHANGELVFTAPWQSRLFATTMRLQENDHISWEQFRAGLIAQIADHEEVLGKDDGFDYWGCWQRSLEKLLDNSEIVNSEEISTTTATLATRPPGHDHNHNHN